jgi:hypothetical protein
MTSTGWSNLNFKIKIVIVLNLMSVSSARLQVCVLPISKLLVREKAGSNDNNGFYLISNPSDPDMYELICQNPKDRKVWIESIRDAIETCPTGDEDAVDEGTRLRDARLARIKQITGEHPV